VENCFPGGVTLRISTTSLHRQKLLLLDYRYVKTASNHRSSVIVDIITQRDGLTTVMIIATTMISRADAS